MRTHKSPIYFIPYTPKPDAKGINIKETNLFIAYEKAIEGYQFQVRRYNTWMSYAAISVGVLFIATYSLWPKESTTYTSQGTWWLLFIISIVGWLICLGWYGALLGYHTWNTHWIGIIKQIEEQIINATNNTSTADLTTHNYSSVYSAQPYFPPSTAFPTPQYIPGYISTQKITGIIIFIISIGWVAIITLISTHLFSNTLIVPRPLYHIFNYLTTIIITCDLPPIIQHWIIVISHTLNINSTHFLSIFPTFLVTILTLLITFNTLHRFRKQGSDLYSSAIYQSTQKQQKQ